MMNLKSFLIFASIVLMTAQTASAFAPSQLRTGSFDATLPFTGNHNNNKATQIGALNNLRPPNNVNKPTTTTTTSTTALNAAADWVTDADLFVGMFIIFCGTTPYVLQIVFPKQINNVFYLPQYVDSIEGRIAEIGWKTRFATLALVVTAWNFWDYNFAQVGVDTALRHSYIAWAIFYTNATYNVWKQATSDPPVFVKESRVGVQAWHLICTLLLWADVSESYTGNAIAESVRRLLGIEG